jgi:hypothetical protein
MLEVASALVNKARLADVAARINLRGQHGLADVVR